MSLIDAKLDSFRSDLGQKLPLLGQLVIVTTMSKKGRVNAALKSDIMRMVSDPPIIAFSCNLVHHTAQNILEQHEFVVNIVGEKILKQAMVTSKDYPAHVNEMEMAGLQAIPSVAVNPPRIAECLVHLECKEESHKTYDNEIIFFGRVVRISIDEEVLHAPIENRYQIVEPIVPLGEYRYASIAEVKNLPAVED